MMYAAHQLQSIIPPKMTAMMQLTDTDFSYVFKNLMRKSVDKIMAKGQQAMGTSDVYQMGECNENIENLLKIVEKRKNTEKHTPPERRTLCFIVHQKNVGILFEQYTGVVSVPPSPSRLEKILPTDSHPSSWSFCASST